VSLARSMRRFAYLDHGRISRGLYRLCQEKENKKRRGLDGSKRGSVLDDS